VDEVARADDADHLEEAPMNRRHFFAALGGFLASALLPWRKAEAARLDFTPCGAIEDDLSWLAKPLRSSGSPHTLTIVSMEHYYPIRFECNGREMSESQFLTLCEEMGWNPQEMVKSLRTWNIMKFYGRTNLDTFKQFGF
jgi:hypothetical protein